MQLIVTADYVAMSRYAAGLMVAALRAHPEARIVVPTGATPEGFYGELAALYRRDPFDTSRLRVFQLDEYLGVAPDDPRSFYGWIRRAFLDPLDIGEAQVVRLRGDAGDPQAACRDYDAAVETAGGFDIVVLGLGLNGHIGFNEPPADPASRTRVVRLRDDTIASNERYWNGQAPVPAFALTCGMAHILSARSHLLLVSGSAKQAILRQAVTGPITPDVPASYLQSRNYVTVIADRAAWPWPHSLADVDDSIDITGRVWSDI
jgi:glucosamine-6-phosphate deaminase